MSELRERYEQFMELYNDLKQEIRRERKSEYERWKAGGFIVDDDIISSYPNIANILETMCCEEEQNELDSLEENEEVENSEELS